MQINIISFCMYLIYVVFQIDPNTRFSFEELTKNFEWLLNKFMGHRASSALRKQKGMTVVR